MKTLTFNGNRYIIKGQVPSNRVEILDPEKLSMVKSYFGSDVIIKQHSTGLHLFLEKIQEAQIIEEYDVKEEKG